MKILMKINCIALRKKIVILLVVCVLIPLLTTNSYIFLSVKKEFDREQQQELERMADGMESELYGSINQQISIADYIDRNDRLNRFLSREYHNESEYYDAYVRLMDSKAIQYYFTVQSANNIVICTANDTILNGNYFVKQKDMEHSCWYQEFTQTGKNTWLYCYYEDGRESMGYVEKGRRIAVMRRMSSCEKDSLMMLDLDYQVMLDKLQLICGTVDGYVCCDDKILFSTLDKNGAKKEFLPLSAYEPKGYSVQRDFQVCGQKLTIYLTEDRSSMGYLLGKQKWALLFLYMFNLILPIVFVYLLYRSLYDRVAATQKYLEHMKNGVYEIMPIEEGTDEIGQMLHSYNLMVVRIKELIEVVFKNKERAQNLEIAKKQAELNALQSQLNPHFVFNALESIRMHSVLKQEAETAKILEDFAMLMRKNIQWNEDFIPIEEECKNVERYLEIQKYRFGDRLEYFLYVQEDCKHQQIPKFIITTFVENSCVHGIEKSVTGGSITVMVSGDDTCLYIEIMDRGSGMCEDELNQLRCMVEQADIEYLKKAEKSIGIMNAVVRMKQYYGEGVQIDISSTQHEGTEVCIQLPKRRGDSGQEDDQGIIGG
ncbi:MAG: sensor histidine kinase [bacterium]|nr:sensor histidine kinase [bacterium]